MFELTASSVYVECRNQHILKKNSLVYSNKWYYCNTLQYSKGDVSDFNVQALELAIPYRTLKGVQLAIYGELNLPVNGGLDMEDIHRYSEFRILNSPSLPRLNMAKRICCLDICEFFFIFFSQMTSVSSAFPGGHLYCLAL